MKRKRSRTSTQRHSSARDTLRPWRVFHTTIRGVTLVSIHASESEAKRAARALNDDFGGRSYTVARVHGTPSRSKARARGRAKEAAAGRPRYQPVRPEDQPRVPRNLLKRRRWEKLQVKLLAAKKYVVVSEDGEDVLSRHLTPAQAIAAARARGKRSYAAVLVHDDENVFTEPLDYPAKAPYRTPSRSKTRRRAPKKRTR